MNRILFLIASLALLVCTGCSCRDRGVSPNATGPDRAELLRVAIADFGLPNSSIRREWKSFQEQSDCNLQLDLLVMDRQSLYESLLDGRGLKEGHWDLALISTDWLAEAHGEGAVVDLTPYIAKSPPEGHPDDWVPSLLRLQQFGDEALGLPYHCGPECLIYRTDMFGDETLRKVYYAKYGYELDVPQTWAEFIRVAEFMNRPERRLYGTAFAAGPDGYSMVRDVCLQLWTRGGELFDADDKLQLDTPEMIETLTFLRAALSNKSAVHPQCREFDSIGLRKAFADGEVVMMIGRFDVAAACETYKQSKVNGTIAVAAVPHGDGGHSESLACYWLLCVASGSPHKQTAYDFARHCISKAADRQRALDGAVGCRRSTWSDAEVLEAVPFYGQMAGLHESARQLPRRTDWAEIAELIEQTVLDAIDSDGPIETIVAQAQKKAARFRGNR